MSIPSRVRFIGMALLLAGGCRHSLPMGPLPADWTELAVPVAGLAALYRMDCCGHHNLVTTVRAGDGALALTVAVPPGGVALEYWTGPDGAAMTENRGRCRISLPRGVLPLPSGKLLPVPPELLAALLSGRVGEAAVPVPDRPGWVSWSESGGSWLRARIAGSPARLHEAEIGRLGEAEPAVVMRVLEHQGRLPSRCVMTVERERIFLNLQSWRTGAPPSRPAWFAAVECAELP